MILEELILREDGSVCGVGNSIEVESQEEAKALIEKRLAKLPELSVGEMPQSWKAPARPRQRVEVKPAEGEEEKGEE